MIIYEEVQKIISPIYLVGGAVRDEILGRSPKDFDFTTPLTPDEIESAIRKAGRKPYLIGKRFGTIGFKVKVDDRYEYVEITTFRNEKYKSGSRKPEVTFVKDINADLSRRDFTINAIAKRGERFIDPFKGRQDIKDRIIQCVGKPNERFREDPLRMLRVARFASQLEFEIHPSIYHVISSMNYKILEVSKERWVMELDKLLLSSHPEIGLEFLAKTRLLNFMIPELSLQVGYDQNNPHHDLELWEHTKKVVFHSPKEINLRWASLLHDIAKPFVRTDREDRSNYIKHDMLAGEFVTRLAFYLRWSNERREMVKNLVLHHLEETSPLKEADNKGKKK